MSNIQIESDLKGILHKVDDLDKRLIRVETKLDSTTDDIKEIKGSQKAQV